MRVRSSLLLILVVATTAACGQRYDARYALGDDGTPPPMQQPAPQDAPAQPAAAVEAAPEAEATPAAPEVTTAAPEEVTAATEPPEPVYEEQTPQATVETVWIPGYWHPEGAGWTWYVGEWRSAPAGHVYAEPHYGRVGTRVVYVRGYWRSSNVVARSYGGTRIIFVRPTRPADYSARYHRPIRGVSGLPAGARLETRYRPVYIAHTPRAAQAPVARVSPEPARARTEAPVAGTTPTTTSARMPQERPGNPTPTRGHDDSLAARTPTRVAVQAPAPAPAPARVVIAAPLPAPAAAPAPKAPAQPPSTPASAAKKKRS